MPQRLLITQRRFTIAAALGGLIGFSGIAYAVNLMRHADPKMTELYQQRARQAVVIEVGELLGGRGEAEGGLREQSGQG